MKKEIMAYVTALSDVYSKTINQPMIKALNDILNFVEDIPTVKNEITDFEIENKRLKGSNRMLEALCDSLIEKNCELVKEKQIINNHNLQIVNDLITVKEMLSGRRTTK